MRFVSAIRHSSDGPILGSFERNVAEVVYAGLVSAIPQLGMEPSGDAAGLTESAKAVGEAADRLGEDSRAFVQFVLRFSDDVAEIVRPVFMAIASSQDRLDVESRLQRALADFSDRVRPSSERQFLVG